MDGLIEVEEACLVGRFESFGDIQEKLNELIRAHNKLVILYSQHYHKHTDLYNRIFVTTQPEVSSERHHEG